MKTTLFLFAFFTLFACGDSDSDHDGMVGEWKVVKAEGPFAEDNLGTIYKFDVGTLTMSKNGLDNAGKSTLTDSTFTWENGSMESLYSYKKDGRTMTVRPSGSTQVLTLEKQ